MKELMDIDQLKEIFNNKIINKNNEKMDEEIELINMCNRENQKILNKITAILSYNNKPVLLILCRADNLLQNDGKAFKETL